MFRPSSGEVVVGRGVVGRYEGAELGGELRVRARPLEGRRHPRRRRLVVRERDLGRRERARATTPSARCPYSGVRVRAALGAADWARSSARIDDDPRYALEAEPETDYYAEQAESANSLYVLVVGIAVLAGIGAGFGAANTMYAAVQARTAEIGTLRALGFSRGADPAAFQIEALALGARSASRSARRARSRSRRCCGAVARRHRASARRPSPPTSSTLRVAPARPRRRRSCSRWRSASSAASAPAWRAARLRPVDALREGVRLQP